MFRIIRKQSPDGTSWRVHPNDWPRYVTWLRARNLSAPLHDGLFMGREIANVWRHMTGGADFERLQVPRLFRLRPGECRYV